MARAILTKQGVQLKEVNELTILKEFERIHEKEQEAIRRLKGK